MQTSRVRSGAAALTPALPAETIASRNGNATVAPTPRRNVRRGICFPVMKSTSRLLSMVYGTSKEVPYVSRALRVECPTCRAGPACNAGRLFRGAVRVFIVSRAHVSVEGASF